MSENVFSRFIAMAEEFDNPAETGAAPNTELIPETPTSWFADIFPGIHEEFGDAIRLTTDRNGREHVVDINDDFFAATLGSEGSPDSPVVYLGSESRFFEYSVQEGIFLETPPCALSANLSDLLHACCRECETEIGKKDLEFKLRGHRLNSVVDRARARLRVPDDFFQKDRGQYITCANGVLRLTDRQLLPFAPSFQSRNKLAVPFIPGACCPRFLDTLLGPAISEEDQQLFQRWLGQVLLGENLAQVILILSGTAGGGKGTLVRVINGVIGGNNVATLRTRQLGERFEIGRFMGKTLLYGADVPPNFLNHTGASVLKSLTGGDPVTVEFKGSNASPEIICRFNVVITCNSRLRVVLEGDVEAWRRRLRIIRFQNPPPTTVIHNLSEVLLVEEGAGILNWMLDGLDKARGEGLQIRGNEAQQKIVDDLLLESESYVLFAKECLIDKQFVVLTVDACFTAYVGYCNRRGWSPVEKREFAGHIETQISHLFGRTKSHDLPGPGETEHRGWRGVGVREP